jgi:NADH-quinone oxidoreductase subunit L
MELTPYLALLLVPTITLGAFVLLGLDPYRLRRSQVYFLALAGGVGPLLIMLPMFGYCAMGECNGVVPIFTLLVGESVVALALLLDPLSAVVGLTVTAVGACVMVYAVAYMDGEKLSDLRRFFALMNLFLAAMLTMVLAGDSIVFFLGWELMGLCSFFLIAYNTQSGRAIAAGRKAFIMTRFADAFLLAALLLLFLEARSVRLDDLIAAGLAMDENRRIMIALLLLGGALGKSAQVPFHTWLPSAMAGPTPVSALLHSATMVAAGAFLMARFSPIVQASPGVPEVVAAFGVVTAAFGSLAALFQKDVKRLLAYSSISQIGVMMLSIGVGAPEVAVAHFVVHAIFKSLLFLSAGEIVHGAPQGTALASMRGAYYRKPLAFLTFAAGAASLAALPLVTAGWWSKEAVIAAVANAGFLGVVMSAVALLSAVLTGAYALRPVVLGLEMPEPSGDAEAHSDHAPAHAPSSAGISPALMYVPLVLLATGAVLGGFLVNPIIHFLGAEPPHAPLTAVLFGIIAPLVGAWIAVVPQPFVTALTRGLERVSHSGRRSTEVPVSKASRQGRLDRYAYKLSQGGVLDRLYRAVFVIPFMRMVHWVNRFAPGNRLFQTLIVAPFLALVTWLNRGAPGDRLYRRGFILPFSRLVRWLNGYRTGIPDPVGNLPVLAAVRLQEAITAPLAHDALDRAWMWFAGGIVQLWNVARGVQTGRARDYALAMASGAAALLLLAWGTA